MRNNPLSVPIARILRHQPEGMSEFELMRQLAFDGIALDQLEGSDGDLLLFRKHFLVMNALYQLQPIFWEEGLVLRISALNIELCPSEPGSSEQCPVADPAEPKLREYYLDWGQFERSSDESVQQLLQTFWQRYYAQDQQQQARELLGLESDYDRHGLRLAYRRLAAIHHPDRGGDAERFCQLRDAYELLGCLI